MVFNRCHEGRFEDTSVAGVNFTAGNVSFSIDQKVFTVEQLGQEKETASSVLLCFLNVADRNVNDLQKTSVN